MFRSKCMFFGLVSVVALAAVAFSATPATAGMILYSDSFTRTGALNGSSPDTSVGQYGATAGAKWIAHPLWTTDGSQAYLNGPLETHGMDAGLPFTPQAGHVYTFSATVNCLTANKWIAMGFSPSMTTGYIDFYSLNTSGWMLSTTTGGDQTFTGPGTTGGVSFTTTAGAAQVQILLDTNPTLWTVEWIVNGTSQRGPIALGASNPTISYLAFGSIDRTQGTFDNVQLSVDIPEPASLALLGAGLLGLLCYAWRKRR